MPKPAESLLSNGEYRAALAAIIDRTFRDTTRVEGPTATLVGGQPGAGKTTLIASQALQRHAGLEDTVLIDFMQWSNFHPRFEELRKIDAQTADFKINKDICALRDDILRHALNVVRCNLLIETWMVLPAKIAREVGYELPEQFVQRMKDFHAFNYQTHLIGLAVPAEVSWQGVLLRDESLRATRGWGQMAPRYFHDALCAVMPDILQLVEHGLGTERLSDRVTLCRRGGGLVYENHLGPDGQWAKTAAGRAHLESERNRPRSVQELAELTEGYETILTMRTKRKATPDEMQEIRTLLFEARRRLPARRMELTSDSAIEGTIAALTESSIYQERRMLGSGSQIIRHDRGLFPDQEETPVVGETAVIQYKGGRGRLLPHTPRRKRGTHR
jgi:Zeta toxin